MEHEAASAVFLHYRPMGTRQARPIPINKYIYFCMVKRQPLVRDAQIRRRLPPPLPPMYVYGQEGWKHTTALNWLLPPQDGKTIFSDFFAYLLDL